MASWCWSSIRMQDAITSSQNPSFSIQQPQIVLKPGDVLPLRAKVAQEYPWEKDKDGFLFREDKEKQGSQYLVCIQIYVTTPDSSSVKWVQPLYSMQPNETWPSELVGRNEPLKVIQRTSWGFS